MNNTQTTSKSSKHSNFHSNTKQAPRKSRLFGRSSLYHREHPTYSFKLWATPKL